MNERQFLVELDIEAKKYAEWLLAQNFEGIPTNVNILDLLDRGTDNIFEQKMRGIRNKLLQNNNTVDAFFLGVSFITLALRHFSALTLEKVEEENRIAQIQLTVENLSKIKEIFSRIETHAARKDLIEGIRPAILTAMEQHGSLELKGDLSPEESTMLIQLKELLRYYTDQQFKLGLL